MSDAPVPEGWQYRPFSCDWTRDDGGSQLVVWRIVDRYMAAIYADAVSDVDDDYATLPEACAAAERAYCGAYVGQVLSPGTAFMLGDVPAIALDPHQCGREAKMCGRPRSDNPCWPESTAWLEWDSGWLGATDISDPILGRNP